MIRTIFLLCIFFGARIFADPFLYVNTMPSLGIGYKFCKSHIYLGLDWYGISDKTSWKNDSGNTQHWVYENFNISPSIGFRYDLSEKVVNPYLNGGIITTFWPGTEFFGMPIQFLLGIGVGIKLNEKIVLAGEYNISYQYIRNFKDGMEYYRGHIFSQVPSICLNYFFKSK